MESGGGQASCDEIVDDKDLVRQYIDGKKITDSLNEEHTLELKKELKAEDLHSEQSDEKLTECNEFHVLKREFDSEDLLNIAKLENEQTAELTECKDLPVFKTELDSEEDSNATLDNDQSDEEPTESNELPVLRSGLNSEDSSYSDSEEDDDANDRRKLLLLTLLLLSRSGRITGLHGALLVLTIYKILHCSSSDSEEDEDSDEEFTLQNSSALLQSATSKRQMLERHQHLKSLADKNLHQAKLKLEQQQKEIRLADLRLQEEKRKYEKMKEQFGLQQRKIKHETLQRQNLLKRKRPSDIGT